MRFGYPRMLWLLAVTVPLVVLFLWWSWRKRQYLVSQFVQSRLLAHLTVGLSKPIQKARMVLLVLAVGLLILTLARPQWGFAWEEATQQGLDIVVAIDTSRSMLAEDIPPNRLQRAKLAAHDLMRLAKRDRLGLVAFAGTAFLQCPLTLDDEAFRQSLNQLDVGIIPQGGTALAEAIETAQTAFKKDGENYRVLVLFTDGEDHDSGALAAAEKAAGAGLRIFTVGVGTPNGELLRAKDAQGNTDYIRDEKGDVVKSRLNENLLTQIATAANGFYLPLGGPRAMDVLYERGLAPLPKSELSSKLIKQFHERYQWPLSLAILLLMLEIFLPDRKRVSRTETIATASNPELRKLVALVVIGVLAPQTMASTSSALRKYEAGQYKDSLHEYEHLLERKPEDPRLQYNAGAAAYQAKKFDDAVKHFSAATTAPELNLQERACYNLGNSLFRVGEGESDAQKKQQSWEQSIKQFESALKLDPKDADASYNLEQVKKALEELKKNQPPPQKNDKNKDKKDSKDDKDQNQDQKQDQQKDQQKDQQQNSKDEQKKEDQKKESKSDQQKDQEKQQQQKDQASQQEQKDKDQGKKDSASQADDKSKQNGETNGTQAVSSVMAGQMSPEQAQQLLDAQKNNEKAMIFLPPDKKQRVRVLKDW